MYLVRRDFVRGIETVEALTGLSQADFDLLSEVAPQAMEWGDELVQIFYDTLFDHSRTAAVFHTAERAEREDTLLKWYLSLFEVTDAYAFLSNQARIGLAHVRRDVHNQFMISVANKMRLVFFQKAVDTYGAERGLEVAYAFGRVLDAVIGLTAEGYELLTRRALSNSTGVKPFLLDHFVHLSLDALEKELLS
ncbi:MAG: hypothetical protein H6631_03325 [Anaerolineaceae bacterium]|nr:hypothetical protein [Anaerolineaceae bacterium]MCB9099724.1 hypothetical protein [Anaerolineales bacterium]